jgi:cell wall-associated NlpC family hydrolase
VSAGAVLVGPTLGRVVLRTGGAVLASMVALLALIGAGLDSAGTAPAAASAVANESIPPAMLVLYQQAATRCPGLSWTVLAGVGAVESQHGRDTSTSAAGAVGPMQFLPSTWTRYGTDGNNDKVADPRNPADAIPAAADYLCSLGVARDTRLALVGYNCGNISLHCQAASAGYAGRVLALAASYTSPIADQPSPVALLAVRTALHQLGTPYLWGGEEPGGFDCSGLVQYAYASAGVLLPRTARDQYRAGPELHAGQQPTTGDLMFFAQHGTVDHVGIYLGNGTMLDAPHTGALVRIEAVHLDTLAGITRPSASASLDTSPIGGTS